MQRTFNYITDKFGNLWHTACLLKTNCYKAVDSQKRSGFFGPPCMTCNCHDFSTHCLLQAQEEQWYFYALCCMVAELSPPTLNSGNSCPSWERKRNSSLNLKLTASRNFGSSHLSLCEFYQKQFGGLFCVILTRNTASTMFYFVFPISYSSTQIQHSQWKLQRFQNAPVS